MDRFKRVAMRRQDASVCRHNFDEVNFGYSKEEAMQEAARCLQCKNPLCVDGCPAHVKIPQFIQLIVDEKFDEAAQKIKEDNFLPAVCGRVCPQEEQCELHCILHKKGAPIAIGHLERFVGDVEEGSDVETVSGTRGTIAIIGSGPAGLAAANELISQGFSVTIFEDLSVIGGILTYGIPDFRLPKSIVNHEIERLKQLGIKFETNVKIGEDMTIDALLNKHHFDAVFIASGLGKSVMLNIPGATAKAVCSANDYLKDHDSVVTDGCVVTIGGGDVAMDAARVSLRRGAKRSLVLYRRTENDMPARTEEIAHAKEEGVEFQFLANPIEILQDDAGQVTGIRCVRMQLSEADESGRHNVIAIEDSEFVIDCDQVIMALGSRLDPQIQQTTPELQISANGTIIVDEQGRTSKPHVYAAGDVVTGSKTVILAIAEARRVCRGIRVPGTA